MLPISRLFTALSSTVPLLSVFRRPMSSHTVFDANSSLFKHGAFTVQPIALLEDNYGYLLTDVQSNTAALVDPADIDKVSSFIQSLQSKNALPRITHILTTHKHWDHAGGNKALKKQHPELVVIGGAHDHVEACTQTVNDGDRITLGQHTLITTLFSPCHTSGHVLYHITDTQQAQQAGVLFTGDTLFIAGCGKFFEGTAAQMHHNLNTTIASLPAQTTVYIGHEYTVSNLQFAQWVEPNNTHIQNKLTWAQQQRQQQHTTLPSSVGEEKQINPFMRVHEQTVKDKVNAYLKKDVRDEVEVMHALREAKNANAHKTAASL